MGDDDYLTSLTCGSEVRHQLIEYRFRIEIFLWLINYEGAAILCIKSEVKQQQDDAPSAG